MSRPLQYLDEVISASESLANPTDEQIILSDKLKAYRTSLTVPVKPRSITRRSLKKTSSAKTTLSCTSPMT